MQKKTFHTTIKEVASVAGVSTETISRVLNEKPDMSSETRKRVKGIIKEIEPKTIMLPPSLVVRQSFL
jgi:LacI family transcriptional regulator